MKKMKKKWGLILAPVATIAICLSLIAGSTFALFTSESSVGITISAGTVAVTSEVENIDVSAKEIVWNADGSYTVTENEGKPGAKADFNEETGLLEIDGMLPGDTVSFDLAINNAGDVANMQYAVECTKGLKLMSALKISVDNEEIGTFKKYTSAWDKLTKDGKTVSVTMELPVENESANGESADIAVNVFAVQENVVVPQGKGEFIAIPTDVEGFITDTKSFESAMVGGGKFALDSDLVLPEATVAMNVDDETVIDLVGNTLTLDTAKNVVSTFHVDANGSLDISNGDIVADGVPNKALIEVVNGGNVSLTDVDIVTDKSVVLFKGNNTNITIDGCNIETSGYYGVTTNAETTDNYNVNIELKNSVITGTFNLGTAVMFNVPGNYLIDNCTITGSLEAVFARAGDITINNTAMFSSGTYDAYIDNDKAWGSGNQVTTGCLVIGSRENGKSVYQAANVVMTGKCSINVEGSGYPIVAWANKNGASLNYSGAELTVNAKNGKTNLFGYDEGATLTIDGEVWTRTETNA